MLLADACAFMGGVAFFDGSTVYPVLLARLGAGDALIGFTRLVQTLGYTLPALVGSHYIHGMRYHKPYLLWTCAIGRVLLLTLPPALLLGGLHPSPLILVWVVASTGLFWLLDGACAVSWFDIVAKCIYERVRGRFFGVMQSIGGLFAIGAGLLVQAILAPRGLPYPANFALLAALWCVGALLSQLFLAMIREPAGDVDEEAGKPGLAQYLRQIGPLFRTYPRLRRLVAARVLLDGAYMAAPFYVLFAQRSLHADLRTVGLYTMLLSAGRLAAGPFWGWLADRIGPGFAVRWVAVAVVAAPLAALGAAYGLPWLMPAVFVLMGATGDGLWMVLSTALLESVEARDRPLAIGVATMCQTPSAVYGPIGGLLTQSTSYPTVFALSAVAGLVGSVAAWRIGANQLAVAHTAQETEPAAAN